MYGRWWQFDRVKHDTNADIRRIQTAFCETAVGCVGDGRSKPQALRWYHWTWAALPMLLVFKSLILGVFFGLAATHWNTKILQSERRTTVKFILVLLVSGTAVALHVLLTNI